MLAYSFFRAVPLLLRHCFIFCDLYCFCRNSSVIFAVYRFSGYFILSSFSQPPRFFCCAHFPVCTCRIASFLGSFFSFSLFLWAYGTHYRLDLIAPISPDALNACPALTASMQGWHLSDDSPYILCYGTAVGTERISERYLLETHGVKGVPKVKIHPFQQQIQLIWESDSAAATQYYLIQCSGAKNFHLTMTLKGEKEQIELFAAAPDENTLSAWGSELETLFRIGDPLEYI